MASQDVIIASRIAMRYRLLATLALGQTCSNDFIVNISWSQKKVITNRINESPETYCFKTN